MITVPDEQQRLYYDSSKGRKSYSKQGHNAAAQSTTLGKRPYLSCCRSFFFFKEPNTNGFFFII